MRDTTIEILASSYEEKYRNHEILVVDNPDQYRGGFEWSVCVEEGELGCGVDFSVEAALHEARKAIDDMAAI